MPKKFPSLNSHQLSNKFYESNESNASLPDHNLSNKVTAERFNGLPIPDNKIQVTYVWIDGETCRCKSKTMDTEPKVADDCSWWQYNGSPSGLAEGDISDFYLKPVALFKDPFRRGKSKIVLCETYSYDMKPTPDNNRQRCLAVMMKVKDIHPWFGIEQIYTMLDLDGHPLGWPKRGYPAPKGPYYCGVGAGEIFGRDIVEAHYRACLYAGVKICGLNSEVMPAQWEYQIGPCEGISMGDELWMSRYLLVKTAEEFGVIINFDPNPIPGNWSSAGAHTSFSTKPMRAEGGIKHIYDAINKLENHHHRHIHLYDPHGAKDNERRRNGELGTSEINKFTFGVGNRSCSVRIPKQVEDEHKGYLEDRRPSSNCDPYVVTHAIVDTCLLREE